MQATILVIDDDVTIGRFLQEMLNEHGYTTYGATSASTGLAALEKYQPDLVLLDLQLPDIDGESVCQEVKKKYPDTKIIMVTGKRSADDIARGLGVGADDYVTKPLQTTELLARIEARLRATPARSDVLRVGDLTMNVRTHEVQLAGEAIALSAQEFKLLHFLMTNPKRVLTRDAIITRIWGMTPEIETRVVDVYIGYLRKKIDRDAHQKYIRSIRGFGYMLAVPKDGEDDPQPSLPG